jgi:hypothetical protein
MRAVFLVELVDAEPDAEHDDGNTGNKSLEEMNH